MGRSTSIQNVLNEVTLTKTTNKKDDLTTDLDPVSWSNESFKLAREKVYLNGKLKGSNSKENALPVPDNYGGDSKKVGQSQVSLAGHRLAKFLAI